MAVTKKLLQVFLSPSDSPSPNISEVYMYKSGDLICTCPGFKGRATCKHVRLVKERIDGNDGAYPMEVSTKATQEDADAASESDEAFREFVVRFGKVEVY